MTRGDWYGRAWFKRFMLLCLCAAVLIACGGQAGGSAGGTTNGGSNSGSTADTPTPRPTLEPPTVPEDVPVMEDADIQRMSEGVLEYRIAVPLQDVIDFYRAETANQGWEASGNPNIMPIVATLRFSKSADDKKVNLTVSMQFNENSQTTLVRLFWQ